MTGVGAADTRSASQPRASSTVASTVATPAASIFAKTSLVVLLVVLLAAVLGIAVAVSFHWVSARGAGTPDALNKVASIWAGFITAALTASMAMLSALFQSRATARLEHVKAGLAQQMEDNRASNATDLETVKTRFARALEFTKGRYAAERKAYDELVGAAYLYYYTIAELEQGRWHGKQVAIAESSMVSACRHLVAVDESHRGLWLQFWQAARTVRDLAEEMKGNNDRTVPQRRKELWATHARILGPLLTTLQSAATARHRSAADTEAGQATGH